VKPAIVTVAPTGPIASRADNPALPVTPEAIADAVVEARELGAAVAHLHLRDADERPTTDPGIAREVIGLIRERCDILVQLSTGVGLGVPIEERATLVEHGPDMASLNPCSMTFGPADVSNPPKEVARLATRMLELGVKPELEVYDTGHLEHCLRMRDQGLLADPLQFSIVLGVAGGMAATPENLVLMASRLPHDAVWQVVAVGRHNLQLTAIGLALGANARAGLEDTLHLRKRQLADGSGPLVRRTVRLVEGLDRRVASPDEAREILGLRARAAA